LSSGAQRDNTIRFGVFEVDPKDGELCKNGARVRFQEQPFQVLLTLLESHGQIVSREELREKVWPDQTFVDFDQGLNTAISKIREALGDSATNPRFVETVPRRGYRFIAPVEGVVSAVESAQSNVLEDARAPVGGPAALRRVNRNGVRYLLLALAAGVVIGYWFHSPEAGPEIPLRHFVITPPAAVSHAAISPNGKHIAFVAGLPEPSVWIHDLALGRSRKMEDTETAARVFWSPDSEFIGFGTQNDMGLKKVSLEGGSPTVLCRLRGGSTWHFSGAWRKDGTIIFTAGTLGGFRVSAQGGEATAIIVPGKPLQGSWEHVRKLPEEAGSGVMLCSFEEPNSTVVTLSVDTGETGEVVSGGAPVYSATGHIVHESWPPSERLISFVPFSLRTLSATGEPTPLARNARCPSVSEDGTLAYIGGPAPLRRLVWLSRSGEKLGNLGQAQELIYMPALSPDGRRVALTGTESQNWDVWVYDMEREVKTRLTTSNPNTDHRPIWSPDGAQIVYAANRQPSGRDVALMNSDGSGESEILVSGSYSDQPTDWSADGRYLLFQYGSPVGKSDIYYLLRNTDGSFGEPQAFLRSVALKRVAKFSPDARYVAYCSNESGRDEVYVEGFPGGGNRTQISRNGGGQPRWSRDGTELFYVEDDTLMRVAVKLTPAFTAEAPEPLFRYPGFVYPTPEQQYDVSADGQHFIAVETLEPEDESSEIHVVQNWYAQFRDQ